MTQAMAHGKSPSQHNLTRHNTLYSVPAAVAREPPSAISTTGLPPSGLQFGKPLFKWFLANGLRGLGTTKSESISKRENMRSHSTSATTKLQDMTTA